LDTGQDCFANEDRDVFNADLRLSLQAPLHIVGSEPEPADGEAAVFKLDAHGIFRPGDRPSQKPLLAVARKDDPSTYGDPVSLLRYALYMPTTLAVPKRPMLARFDLVVVLMEPRAAGRTISK